MQSLLGISHGLVLIVSTTTVDHLHWFSRLFYLILWKVWWALSSWNPMLIYLILTSIWSTFQPGKCKHRMSLIIVFTTITICNNILFCTNPDHLVLCILLVALTYGDMLCSIVFAHILSLKVIELLMCELLNGVKTNWCSGEDHATTPICHFVYVPNNHINYTPDTHQLIKSTSQAGQWHARNTTCSTRHSHVFTLVSCPFHISSSTLKGPFYYLAPLGGSAEVWQAQVRPCGYPTHQESCLDQSNSSFIG